MSTNKPAGLFTQLHRASLFVGDTFSTQMCRKGETFTRHVERFEKCDCYRNLGKADFFSIRPREGQYKGLVSGYSRTIILQNPSFHVNTKAITRIRTNQTKEVHAYVRGELYDCFDGIFSISMLKDPRRVSYNPYLSESFYTLSRNESGEVIRSSMKPITDATGYQFALIQDKDLLLFNE